MNHMQKQNRDFLLLVFTHDTGRVWVITFTFGQLLLVFQLLCSVWILRLHGPGFRHSVVNRPMTCSCRIKFFLKISTLQGRINLRFNNRDHHGGLHKAVLNGKEADVEQLLSSGKGNWKNCSLSYCLSGWAVDLIARDRFVKVMSQLWMKKDLVKVGDEVKQSHWTAGREVDVAVMWSSTKHLTFNVPISTEELKKVPANCTGNLTNFTIPSRGEGWGKQYPYLLSDAHDSGADYFHCWILQKVEIRFVCKLINFKFFVNFFPLRCNFHRKQL